MNTKRRIAYLAPEIPALSATFVYNEILGLEEKGFEVFPISVHVPGNPAKEPAAKELGSRTNYLYKEGIGAFLRSSFSAMVSSPFNYFKTLSCAVSDSFRVGITSRVGRGLLYRFVVSSRVAAILKENKCEHLHVHFAHIPTDIAMYASSLSGVPFSFTSHANDLFERGWLLKEKVSRSRFAVTISEHNRKFLISKGASAEKIQIVRCGVNSRVFESRGDKPLDVVPKIGSLGRMVEKKGFDVLIRACGILKDNGIDFQLELAGNGPLRGILEGMVNDFGLSKQVIFKGSLSHDQVPEWTKELDLFVLPCKKDCNGDMDGIPVVLMEAMLSGVPVVSTKISGIPELIEDGRTGLLAEPDDHESLTEIILDLLCNEKYRQQLAQNAISRVHAEFDLSKNIERLILMFEG